ncbi:Bug family tripartite tricarboxylate transporter substrate binding protein [Roseomonas populi]|uniref:Tripartite tricarboxylate transporter substrate binding protein n=1 Tax=Roseomonas populi TaxID=3121582 RepID=A0ABT1XBD0_9PROT|nr:tripartite tricarboxylate transporter substrate binding protein [Roseomonas pecuniae]MCR0985446.1 tripartite tricarboxylate transporter substrate binding protein [Roseomonas pecuniae]
MTPAPAGVARRAVLAGMLSLPAVARAQTPWSAARSISLVVPFAAGGTTDVMARLLAEQLGPRLGQTVVVENVTGAGGNIGAERVARASGDGHTALFAHVGVFAINGHLYRSPGFQSERDFAPVGVVCTNPMVLLVSARSGIADLEGLLRRARSGDLRIATSGAGSTLHLAALQFLDAAGGRADLIPYRGGAPAVNDLLAGQVDMLIEQAFSAIPNSRDGMARALLVTGAKRLDVLPAVPTAGEAGLPGLDMEVWNALVLPSAAPAPVRAAWEAALAASLKEPSLRHRYEGMMGRIPAGQEATAAHLGALIANDTSRWGEVLRHSNAARMD